MNNWNLTEWYSDMRTYTHYALDSMDDYKFNEAIIYQAAEIIDQHILHLSIVDLHKWSKPRMDVCMGILKRILLDLGISEGYSIMAMRDVIYQNEKYYLLMDKYRLTLDDDQKLGTQWKYLSREKDQMFQSVIRNFCTWFEPYVILQIRKWMRDEGDGVDWSNTVGNYPYPTYTGMKEIDLSCQKLVDHSAIFAVKMYWSEKYGVKNKWGIESREDLIDYFLWVGAKLGDAVRLAIYIAKGKEWTRVVREEIGRYVVDPELNEYLREIQFLGSEKRAAWEMIAVSDL